MVTEEKVDEIDEAFDNSQIKSLDRLARRMDMSALSDCCNKTDVTLVPSLGTC